MKRILYLCLAISLFAMPLHAEDNKCEKIVQELKDSNIVCCIGYGQSTKKKNAVAQAEMKAKKALLEVLRDSVAQICYYVEVQEDEKGEFLNIQYFNKKDIPRKFYFHQEGILNDITIQCRECRRKNDNEYEASCVMSAPKDDFSRASNIVMFQILIMFNQH